MARYVLETTKTTVGVDLAGSKAVRTFRGLPVLKKGERTDFGITLRKAGLGAKDRRDAPNGLARGIVKRLPRGIFRASFCPESLTADCSYSGGISTVFALTLGVNYSFQAFQEALDVFFLHAASMVIGGKAYLFPAPSGGGKSTISRLAGERGIKVLGDDTCVIKRKGRKFFVGAYPLSAIPGEGKDAWELDSVLFLSKAEHSKVRSITSVEAVKRALPETMCYFAKGMVPAPRSGYSKHIFRSLCDMFENARFGALDFAKNGEVFSCLD